MSVIKSRIAPIWWAVLGTGALFASLSPVLLSPVVGDDFRSFFVVFARADGNLANIGADVFGRSFQGGRVNPLGQSWSVVYNFAAFWSSSTFGFEPAVFYRSGSFFLVLATVLSASYALKMALKFSSVEDPPSFWPIFSLLAVVTGATIQLHPWSHDPTITLTEIGYPSALIGFLIIGAFFDGCTRQTVGWRMLLPLGALSTGGVLFYEGVVPAVVAGAAILVLALRRSGATAGAERMGLLRLALVGVVLPAAVFLGGRILVSLFVSSGGYTGLDVVLDASGAKTFLFLLLGSVPASAWWYSAVKLDPISIPFASVVAASLALAFMTAVALLWRKAAHPSRSSSRVRWESYVPFALFSVLSVALHGFNAKYIAETLAPGHIYISYAVSLVATASIVSLVLISLHRSRRPLVATIALATMPFAGGFVVVQQAINWSLAIDTRSLYSQNVRLERLAASGDGDEDVRCAAQSDWIAQALANRRPQYYVDSVVESANMNYRIVFDDDFCDDPRSGVN